MSTLLWDRLSHVKGVLQHPVASSQESKVGHSVEVGL